MALTGSVRSLQAAARQESDAGQTGLARPPSQLSMQAAAGEGEEAQGGSEQSLAAFGARLASLAKGEGANPQLAGLLKVRQGVCGLHCVGRLHHRLLCTPGWVSPDKVSH